MLWKSKHGTEYTKFEKASMVVPSARRTSSGARKRRPVQRQVQELGSRNRMVLRFLNSWAAHAPVQLQGLMHSSSSCSEGEICSLTNLVMDVGYRDSSEKQLHIYALYSSPFLQRVAERQPTTPSTLKPSKGNT